MGSLDASVSALGSLASASMGSYYDKSSQKRAYEYAQGLNRQMYDLNRGLMLEEYDMNRNHQVDMLNRSQNNAIDLLNREQDYNTRFAANSALLNVNGLRNAGLNPAAASAQLLSPGVSGPAAASGSGSPASGGVAAGGSVPPLNSAASILAGVVPNAIQGALLESQTAKNLADAGKSTSDTALNDIEAKYRDKVLSQQIVTQGLQNGLLDYELAYKINTYDESIKSVLLSNLETISRTDLNEEQKRTEIERQRQLSAAADELQARANRIDELLGHEKAEIISRIAMNNASALLSKSKVLTEDSLRELYGSNKQLNEASIDEIRSKAKNLDSQTILNEFDKKVKDELGANFYADMHRNKKALDDLAIYWYNLKTDAEIYNLLTNPNARGTGVMRNVDKQQQAFPHAPHGQTYK